MRVLLVGSPRARATLRAQLLDSSIDVVGEFDTADGARDSGLDADALVTALGRADSRARAAPAAAAESDAFEEPLTPRERQVLELLADGAPNKAIALRLGISDQTVKFHVSAIIGKLGVTNRTEAVRVAVRRGVIAV